MRKKLFIILFLSIAMATTFSITVYVQTVYAQDFHDVAVAAVAANVTWVNQGGVVEINVTVENQGNVSDWVNTTCYASAIVVGEDNTWMEANTSQVLTFNWDTAGVAADDYVISALVAQVQEETDIGDNALTDGVVSVRVHDVGVTSVLALSSVVFQGGEVTVDITVENFGSETETSFNVSCFYDNTWICNHTVQIPLFSGMSTNFNCIWNTTGVAAGTYTVKAQTFLVGDMYLPNDALTDGSVTVVVHDLAVLNCSVFPDSVTPGCSATLSCVVENNGSVFETFVVGFYAGGTLLGNQTVTSLSPGQNTSVTFYWDTAGYLKGVYLLSAYANPVPGEVDSANNVGFAPIVLEVHDVAVLAVSFNSSVVVVGFPVEVNVTVANNGDVGVFETFVVAVYVNGSVCAVNQTVNGLAANSSIVLSFIWNTSGWGEGLYNVSAVAGPVLGELNMTNNIKYAETGSTPLYINLVPEFPSLWIIILAITIIIPTYYYIRGRKKQRPINSSKQLTKNKNIRISPADTKTLLSKTTSQTT